MKWKSALKVMLVPSLLVLLSGAPANAQVLLSTFPVPEEEAIIVSGSLLALSSLTTTIMTFTFPGPLPGDVNVEGATGLFAGSVGAITSGNTVQVFLPAVGINFLSGSFQLTDVPFPGGSCTGIEVTLSSSLNNYILEGPLCPSPTDGGAPSGSLLFMQTDSPAPAGYTLLGQQQFMLSPVRAGRGGATVLIFDVYVKD